METCQSFVKGATLFAPTLGIGKVICQGFGARRPSKKSVSGASAPYQLNSSLGTEIYLLDVMFARHFFPKMNLAFIKQHQKVLPPSSIRWARFACTLEERVVRLTEQVTQITGLLNAQRRRMKQRGAIKAACAL